MFGGQQPHGLNQLLGCRSVLQVREQYDETAAAAKGPEAGRGEHGIGFSGIHLTGREESADPRDRPITPRWSELRDGLSGKHQQAHGVTEFRGALGQPCGNIDVETQTVDLARGQPACAPGIDRHDHLEMPVLGHVPADGTPAAGARLPVDEP
jgi:hypothetical protein